MRAIYLYRFVSRHASINGCELNFNHPPFIATGNRDKIGSIGPMTEKRREKP